MIDSTLVDGTALTDLEELLYGTGGSAPSLPSPDDVIAIFAGSVTSITLSKATFDGAHTITIPSQTGTQFYVDGVAHAAGTVTLTTGQSKIITARPTAGYVFTDAVRGRVAVHLTSPSRKELANAPAHNSPGREL